MSIRQLSIALIALASFTTGTAEACCLTDWLFGRTATPYAVGYAPYGQTYAAGYAPVTPYFAGYGSYNAGLFGSGRTALPIATPALGSGVYQAQRPSYNNPSVYTGLPVGTNAQTAYRAPITTPGLLQTGGIGSSYFGASNQYPTTQYPVQTPVSAYGTAASGYSGGMPINSSYASGYAGSVTPGITSPGLPMTPSVVTGAPVTAMPTTQVAPLFPGAPAPRPRGGLARFFGSLFGTNYTSSYYRAPVTYYRPVTSVDPISGTTVTVQQPCTSYQQQLQRTPYSSFQAGPTGQPTLPSTGCQTTTLPYGSQVGGYNRIAPVGSLAPAASYGGVQQAGGYSAPNQFTVPIPSTAPAGNSTYAQPGYSQNTSPLTGSPTQPQSQPDLNRGYGDSSPVDQPQLKSNRFDTQEKSPYDRDSSENESEKPRSYWQLQEAEDSTALIRPELERKRRLPSSWEASTAKDPISLSNPSFTSVEPIPGPDEDAARIDRYRQDQATPVKRTILEAPPLPPASRFETRNYESGVSSASARRSAKIREAGLMRTSYERPAPARLPARQPERDNNWTPIR